MDRILVIHQDKTQGNRLAEKLRRAGHHALAAGNEDEALELLKTDGASTTENLLNQKDFSFGPFTLVFSKARLLKDGIPVPLSYMECKLLMYLVQHREQIVPTHDLMRTVWDYGETVSSGTIYTHISWLRKKLKTPQKPGGYITTLRNMGYLFSVN